MDNQVLVTYASKYGATSEIAEKIGQVLREAGLRTEVLPTDRVSDLTPYKAVVLGSAVYLGQWRKEAVKFLQANQESLSERQVWLFSSGPTGEGEQAAFMNSRCLPDKLQPMADLVAPHDIAVFHGATDLGKLNFIEKWMLTNTNTPIGDFRDWEVITSWATAIANKLRQTVC